MSKIDNVLVAIDFSDGSRAALEYATTLTRKLGARLKALHVAPPYVTYEPFPAFSPPPPLDPERQGKIQEDLQRFVNPGQSEHPLAESCVREGDPADEILGYAAASGADLVVLGTHGRRGFERWLLGSVTERVVRKASCSVLAIPPTVRAPAATSAHVLCALDLADSSAETLEVATLMAQVLGAGLIVLYVADGSHWFEPGPLSGLDVEAARQAVAKSSRERLGELIARHVPKSASVDVQVAFGRAQQEIELVARKGAALVVLGAGSSRGVDRFFFGSTAQHVLRAGVGPVMLVRPRLVRTEGSP